MIQRLASLFDRRPTTAEAWLARMGRSRVGARDQAAFLAWLEQDDANLDLYEAAKADRAALSSLRGAFEGDLVRLRTRRSANSGRRVLIAGGLATAAVAATVLIGPMVLNAPSDVVTRHYASDPGQILDVVLDDGSRVTLDAVSSIQVAYAEDVRRVTLVQGAAYFDVAHNVARPFQVSVADQHVIVTGTRFVTILRDGRAEVSLLEGRVAIGRQDVTKHGAVDSAVTMRPGQRARFTPGAGQVSMERADVETAAAWRERRLIFHDVPLSTVIEAAGRYVDVPMVIADPALGKVRITVVLPLTGEGALIDRMDALLPISVERTADGRALIRAD